MVKWALSGEVFQNVRAMSNATENTFHTHHKEDANGRIKARQEDHLSLRNTLDVCINPFDNESHPDGALMNIMTGQIVHPDMNANNALALGQQAITDFKSGWPGTFYEPLSKLFVPMDVKKSMCQLVWSVSMIRNVFMHVLLVYLPVHVITQLPCTKHHNIWALLWVISWPLDKLHVYVDAFKKFVFQAL